MHLFNLRIGFATNSSSCHSIVVLDAGVALRDRMVEKGRFGYEEFHAASEPAKKKYLAEALYQNLTGLHDPSTTRRIIFDWLGMEKDPEGELADRVGFRQVNLPLAWGGGSLDGNFFNELKSFLLRQDVAIIGGSNGPEPEFPPGREFAGIFLVPEEGAVARKDPAGNYWTVFSRETGDKVRFSFDEKAPAPVKAFAPELIDLKLTSYCEAGCPYCYQDSSTHGKHADLKTIERISSVLSELKVFEVALGGGEPLSHPDFPEILASSRRKGVVPNFTTRRLDWLDKKPIQEAVFTNAGGFAFSVTSPEEMQLLAEFRTEAKTRGVDFKWTVTDSSSSRKKLSANYVLGTGESVEKIMEAAHRLNFPLLLLDYKRIGRASEVGPLGDGDWLEAVKKLLMAGRCPVLGIDTPIAAREMQRLSELNIPRALYEVREGAFSMYIDAVNHKVGPSSYCKPSEMIDVDLNNLEAGQLIEIFSRF